MKKIYSLLLFGCIALSARATVYCIPAPVYASSSCSAYGMGITPFHVTGSSGSVYDSMACTGAGYEDQTALSCIFLRDSVYTAYISTGYAYNMNSQAWIDFNDNGVFEASESVGGINNYIGASNTFTITIPLTAPVGSHRMRLIGDYYGSMHPYPSMDPCMGGYNYGDSRDYTAIIDSAVTTFSGCTGTPGAGTATVTTAYACAGSSITLSDTGYSVGSGITYQWQASTDGGASWFNISGATSATYTSGGTAITFSYRYVATCSGSGLSDYSAMVTDSVNIIQGHITFTSAAPDTISLKVWLIKFDTTLGTLIAADSMITCLDSGTAFYQFRPVASGLYLVKAKSLDITSSMTDSSGFIPTYGFSSPYWDSATFINHVSGLDSLHILMVYGTVPAGPGFIGGFITSGAGRLTTTDVPAVGMQVFLRDASTNQVLTCTYTDTSGAYSFGNIANGTYVIYPEALIYTTTPSAIVTVDSAGEMVNNVNFKQHTTAKTITPNLTTGIGNTVVQPELAIAPNPAGDFFNFMWGRQPVGQADLIIRDVAGRVMVHSVIDINKSSGQIQISTSGLSNGIYFVGISSANINFSSKVVVQK